MKSEKSADMLPGVFPGKHNNKMSKPPGSHHRSRGAILILMLSFSSRYAAFRFLATQAQARTAQMAAAAAAARTP